MKCSVVKPTCAEDDRVTPVPTMDAVCLETPAELSVVWTSDCSGGRRAHAAQSARTAAAVLIMRLRARQWCCSDAARDAIAARTRRVRVPRDYARWLCWVATRLC
eukprot:4565806-Prymnesium_polylepis.1